MKPTVLPNLSSVQKLRPSRKMAAGRSRLAAMLAAASVLTLAAASVDWQDEATRCRGRRRRRAALFFERVSRADGRLPLGWSLELRQHEILLAVGALAAAQEIFRRRQLRRDPTAQAIVG